MTMQDPVADLFVRIKNAQMVTKDRVVLPSSKLKVAVLKVLKDEGYISDYYESNTDGKAVVTVVLKYHHGKPVIEKIQRVSRPGIRIYRGADELPKVMGGLGIAIVSTPKGLMSDRAARAIKQGGEVIGIVA